METPPEESSSSASPDRGTITSTDNSSRRLLLDQKVPAAVSSADESWLISVKTVGGGIDVVSNSTAATTSSGSSICSSSSSADDHGHTNDNDYSGAAVPHLSASTSSGSGERQFTVQVSPEDDLESLYDQIEASTGLKASQQRLIYRGRLIGPQMGATSCSTPPAAAAAVDKQQQQQGGERDSSSYNNPKIKDIAGLADGQTIHLVKRRETPETTSAADGGARSSLNNNNSSPTDGDLFGSSSGSGGGGGLLAALLGLSGIADESSSSSETTTGAANGSRPRLGLRGSSRMNQPSSTNGHRSSRRPHYRMTAEDRQVPDPGSMEPVRQGLLTLHTLLPHLQTTAAPTSTNTNTPTDSSSDLALVAAAAATPIESNREWYRGQWLDVLDTVNQWLEATVVEIVNPEDILPLNIITNSSDTNSTSTGSRPRRRAPPLPRDPAVSASDLEGRRRLLLEPCDEHDDDDNDDEQDLGGDLAGFRPRASNHGVQLLLVHYNGWPHRWDEWIRSDSGRLRPFRTRTRHPNGSSTASPSPQSVFHEAPRTNILPRGDDTEDRMALLPELARAMAAVNDILQRQVSVATGVMVVEPTSSPSPETATATYTVARGVNPDLPWLSMPSSSSPQQTSDTTTTVSPDLLVPPSEGEETSNIIRPWEDSESEIENENENDDDDDKDVNVNTILEELFDPTNFSSSDPTDDDDNHNNDSTPLGQQQLQYNQRDLQNLATLLDRLGRTLTDAAPQIASLAANLPSNNNNEEEDEDEEVMTEEDEMYEEAVEQALEEIAESLPAESSSSDTNNPADTSIGGLLSLWSRERRRSRANNNNSNGNGNGRRSRRRGSMATTTTGTTSASSHSFLVDPDHEDYVGGLVNTTRGEVRTGPRGRSSNDDLANLLGAYLAAATLGGSASLGDGGDGDQGGGLGLGQLLRGGSIGGGGGGGGIDIHIHAVVTAPGMPPGGLGITTLNGGGGGGGGGGNGTAMGTGLGGTRNLFSSTRRSGGTGSILRSSRHSTSSLLSSRRRMNAMEDEEDTDLFAELYSETPEPINPNGSPAPGERTSPRQASLGLHHHHHLRDTEDEDASDYITGLRSSYSSGSSFRREMETPADFLARINHQALDHTNVGAASVAGRSSTRRRSSHRSFRRESSAEEHSTDTGSNSPRRSSGWGRLFRRRSTRDP